MQHVCVVLLSPIPPVNGFSYPLHYISKSVRLYSWFALVLSRGNLLEIRFQTGGAYGIIFWGFSFFNFFMSEFKKACFFLSILQNLLRKGMFQIGSFLNCNFVLNLKKNLEYSFAKSWFICYHYLCKFHFSEEWFIKR